MNNILVIGAGRSSTALIGYILKQAKEFGWDVTVADANLEMAEEKVGDHPNGKATRLDVMNVDDRQELVGRADVVVSLLPAHLHLEVAHDCIRLKKHLITASYVSKELYQLGDEARDLELIFMGEMGLDPGIDHMSAMQKIDEIKEKGGVLTGFKSYTGGLIAPESDDNPWNYKFTWNPRNVVLAGQGTAQYLEEGKFKYVPYNRLFSQYWTVDIQGMGEYDVYANRDSLLYREIYGLQNTESILRGTIRHVGFCDAWNALIKLGLTDGTFPLLECQDLTYHSLIDAYLGHFERIGKSVKERCAEFLEEDVNGVIMNKLDWLGLFSEKRINMDQATPALILEKLLLEKWKLKEDDKDMIIMQHEFEYTLNGENRKLTSTLVLKGHDQVDTAMSRLVGLPLGIFVKNVMEGKIKSKGVNIPVMKEVYDPVLKELEDYGVVFVEKEEILEA